MAAFTAQLKLSLAFFNERGKISSLVEDLVSYHLCFLGSLRMALTYHPRAGQLLHCDFSEGFREPEMVKKNRPVIVITPPMKGRSKLVTVVALSTARPEPILGYHLEISRKYMPMLGRFQQGSSWLKGDMIYSVGFHRFDMIKLGTRDPRTRKRKYFTRCLSRDRMRDVYKCVLTALNLGHVAEHI